MTKRVLTILTLALALTFTLDSCGPRASKKCKRDRKNVKKLRKNGMMM